ncbi:MAG: NfeD family protein [Actinomycetota bacterium]|nr:NfeD family protein [Actinomycetota bacterium]
MGWLSDHLWETWLIGAVALGVLELVSLDLVLVMLAGGALVGALVAATGLGAGFQVMLALATALALLGLVRPNVVRRMHAGPSLTTGVEQMIGKRATVLRELTHGTPGRVRIDGEEWTAEPYDEDDQIEPGETVDVVQIKGATAYVLRVHRLEP